MRFEDINDGYTKILKTIYADGKLKGKRKEIYFLTFTLENIDKNILFFPFAQRNWPWILRECSDRIFGIKNPGIASLYSKNWENRKEDSGLFSYHYSDRLNGQMNDKLSKKIHGRDKIIHIWDKADYYIDGRQPCTIIMQPFTEADNKLSMTVYMRNNDMVNIFPSDIFIHSTYLKYWAMKKNLDYGKIYWVAAIAYYQKKRDKLKFIDRLLESWKLNYSSISPTHWSPDFITDLQIKEEYEKSLRENSSGPSLPDIKTDYVREWAQIMALYHYKKNKQEFQKIYNLPWVTEFKYIKDSLAVKESKVI
jgi:thymidylate synthase